MVFPDNQALESGSTQKNSFRGFSGRDYAANLKFTILIDRFLLLNYNFFLFMNSNIYKAELGLAQPLL